MFFFLCSAEYYATNDYFIVGANDERSKLTIFPFNNFLLKITYKNCYDVSHFVLCLLIW
jgi:hypothetical protein